MYEENRRFSWTNLFIKIIIVVIFILFTVWLLSLSTKSATKGISNSLDVLTDRIFSENIEKMKEVGKSYFTTERLPQKIGEVKTLSLAKMYDENLILELKDKNGNACSAKNSYVSIEKMDTEYQMKVYLECGEESDFIKVIMGCYNYCSTDICEKKTEPETNTQNVEYEYGKTTGGSWTSYGSWSNWSKTSVTKTDYRDVETKVVKENYSYDKTVTETKYTTDATCPTVDGYTLQSKNNGLCTYTKIITDTTNPNKCAASYNGYTLVSQNGFTCNYSRIETITVNANSCAKTYGDYELVSQNGLTCNYSKTKKVTVNANSCAKTYGDYALVSQNGLTCNYAKTATETITAIATTTGGGTTKNCYDVVVGTKTVWSCKPNCTQEIQNVYETRCDTIVKEAKTTYSCPSSEYTLNGAYCTRTITLTTTTKTTCPSGAKVSGNSCVKNETITTTTKSTCPSDAKVSDNSCVKSTKSLTTTEASCPTGYSKRGTICAKDTTSRITKDSVCPSGEKMNAGKCYKNVTTTKTITETRNVTYYRYRIRDYKGGTTDYKWSTSNNDKSLLNDGYKLTGKTRNIGGK